MVDKVCQAYYVRVLDVLLERVVAIRSLIGLFVLDEH